jgi:semaphorin 6
MYTHMLTVSTVTHVFICFSAPNFVSSMAYEDYIFFFFRETAVEYINCGKVRE